MNRIAAPVFRFGGVMGLMSVAPFVVLLSGCKSTEEKPPATYDRPAPVDEVPGKRPPSARTLHSMARVLAAQGKDEQCQFVLKRIIRDHPQFVPAHCDLAELYLRRGNSDAALETLVKAFEVAPGHPLLLNDLGMVLMVKEDYEAALDAFTQAAGARPQDARYRANMAVCLGMLGRDEEALALYKQVVPVDEAYHNLSVLCEARKAASKDENTQSNSRRPDNTGSGGNQLSLLNQTGKRQ